MDEAGLRLASRRLPEGLSGIGQLHALIAERAKEPDQVVIGVETDRGLWLAALVAAGYQVFAVNPLAAARYRDRHHVSGAKSDASDAKLLADLVRTDRHNHRVAGDSADAEAIKVLARSHQNLIWTRTRHTNALRNALREYYPAALTAFDDLSHGDALGVLGRAPSPEQAARPSLAAIQSALKRGGRQRNIADRAREIRAALRTDQLSAPAPVSAAFAATTRATVAIIAELNRQIADLETTLAEHFETHPDADIYLSLPGLGVVLGARVLGEFGDDPNRYTDVKSRRNYAGTSPLSVASGKKRAVLSRHVRNRRLYDAIDRWAFCALSTSPGVRLFYDQRRAAGDTHHQTLRALGNRLVGILHGCLRHHTNYDSRALQPACRYVNHSERGGSRTDDHSGAETLDETHAVIPRTTQRLETNTSVRVMSTAASTPAESVETGHAWIRPPTGLRGAAAQRCSQPDTRWRR